MPSSGPNKGFAARLLPYTTIILLIVAGYVGWIFYSRWQDAKSARERAAAEKEAENKKVVDQVFGGGSVRLLNFSISPIRLERGKTARLCYGVANAVSVAITPHIEDTKPSYNHCLDIAPAETTTYTLSAKDQAGHEETGSLTVKVQ